MGQTVESPHTCFPGRRGHGGPPGTEQCGTLHPGRIQRGKVRAGHRLPAKYGGHRGCGFIHFEKKTLHFAGVLMPFWG